MSPFIRSHCTSHLFTRSSAMAKSRIGPLVDWGDAPEIFNFYGREEEKSQLMQWIVQEQCCVVSVLGIGGIGKSVLSINIMHQLVEEARRGADDCMELSLECQARAGQGQDLPPTMDQPSSESPCSFEVVIFRSLRDAPSCEVLIDECLQVLSPQVLSIVPSTIEQRISLLLSHLRQTRVLVVLDNIEGLLQEGDLEGRFRPGF